MLGVAHPRPGRAMVALPLPFDLFVECITFLDITDDEDRKILNLFDSSITTRKAVLNRWRKATKYKVLRNALCTSYYVNEQLHRKTGPAVEYTNGRRDWFLHGRRHRVNGPAIQWPSGSQEWYFNGLLHCEYGPALTRNDGRHYEWLVHGRHHRVDGPAIQRSDGTKLWFVRGVKIKQEDNNHIIVRPL